MKKIKIGSRVLCRRGYSFDPSIGIVKSIVKLIDTSDYYRVKILIGQNNLFCGRFWAYNKEDLTLITKKIFRGVK